MQNYKVYIDFFDVFQELRRFNLYEFNTPFTILFIEAASADEACSIVMHRLQSAIMKQDPSIDTRVICRKIRRSIRIDKVYSV